jgi:hypothetical protein
LAFSQREKDWLVYRLMISPSLSPWERAKKDKIKMKKGFG